MERRRLRSYTRAWSWTRWSLGHPPSRILFIVGFAKWRHDRAARSLSTLTPDVHPSSPKEPHFFIEQMWRRSSGENRSGIPAVLAGASKDARVFLDSSAVHIYSPQALRKIREFNPAPGSSSWFEPGEHAGVLPQVFLSHVRRGRRKFRGSLGSPGARAKGNNLPKGCEFPVLLQYENLGRVGKHVATLLEIWPRSR